MNINWEKILDHPSIKMSMRYGLFRESLASESDRGCAVLALCVIEDIAKEAIRRRIGVFKDMLEVLCPHGRWSVTVKSLCMLGIISMHEKSDLKRLIVIRNEFAHKALEDLSFDTIEIASRIDQLKLVRWYWQYPQPETRRERFLLTVHLLHTMMSNRGGNAVPMEPCAEFVVVPDESKDKYD